MTFVSDVAGLRGPQPLFEIWIWCHGNGSKDRRHVFLWGSETELYYETVLLSRADGDRANNLPSKMNAEYLQSAKVFCPAMSTGLIKTIPITVNSRNSETRNSVNSCIALEELNFEFFGHFTR